MESTLCMTVLMCVTSIQNLTLIREDMLRKHNHQCHLSGATVTLKVHNGERNWYESEAQWRFSLHTLKDLAYIVRYKNIKIKTHINVFTMGSSFHRLAPLFITSCQKSQKRNSTKWHNWLINSLQWKHKQKPYNATATKLTRWILFLLGGYTGFKTFV